MKISTLLALAVGCSALSTLAQEGPAGRGPGGPPRGRGMMAPLMRALDKNTNGVIDAEEIESATAALKALDKNSDGKLTADELMPERPGRPAGSAPGGQREGARPPVPPLLAALDANHDGEVDATEINNASAALRALDKDGDGRLTMAEIRPPGRGRPGGQGGRGPGGPGRGQGGPGGGGPGGGGPGGGGRPGGEGRPMGR